MVELLSECLELKYCKLLIDRYKNKTVVSINIEKHKGLVQADFTFFKYDIRHSNNNCKAFST